MTHAGKNVRRVALNFHTAAAAVALLAAPEFTVQKGLLHLKPGGQAREEGNQSFAVRFSGGKITQHRCSILPDVATSEWLPVKQAVSCGFFTVTVRGMIATIKEQLGFSS